MKLFLKKVMKLFTIIKEKPIPAKFMQLMVMISL